jgi:hypothetical protein
MTNPFVDQLADLSRQHVTRAKWVFVPAHGVGHTIGERIALGGTNWLNLRFVTPLDVALRMGAPFLVERGIEPAHDHARVGEVQQLPAPDGEGLLGGEVLEVEAVEEELEETI